MLLKDGNIELFYIGLSLSKPSEAIEKGNKITSMAMYKAVFDTDLNLVSQSKDPVLAGANIVEVHYRDGVYHTFSTKSPRCSSACSPISTRGKESPITFLRTEKTGRKKI